MRYAGAIAEVIEDLGDTIRLAAAPRRFRTRAGDHLAVPPGQVEVGKADLVLETLGETPEAEA